jgi:hypothetical protein
VTDREVFSVRMSEDKVRTKYSCWTVGTIHDPRKLSGVSIAGPGIGRVLHRFTSSLDPTHVGEPLALDLPLPIHSNLDENNGSHNADAAVCKSEVMIQLYSIVDLFKLPSSSPLLHLTISFLLTSHHLLQNNNLYNSVYCRGIITEKKSATYLWNS